MPSPRSRRRPVPGTSRRGAPGRALLALAATLSLASCSTPHRINLKDGTVIDSQNRPSLSTKTGYWRYEDRFGKDALIRAEEVLLIEKL